MDGEKHMISAMIGGIMVLCGMSMLVAIFWQRPAEMQAFQSLHGEWVVLQGHGLYARDSVSLAAH